MEPEDLRERSGEVGPHHRAGIHAIAGTVIASKTDRLYSAVAAVEKIQIYRCLCFRLGKVPFDAQPLRSGVAGIPDDEVRPATNGGNQRASMKSPVRRPNLKVLVVLHTLSGDQQSGIYPGLLGRTPESGIKVESSDARSRRADRSADGSALHEQASLGNAGGFRQQPRSGVDEQARQQIKRLARN